MIVQKACITAHYSEASDGSGDDALFIKEAYRGEDGTITKKMVLKENREYPFWISKPGVRKTHKYKKEHELMENLNEYRSRRSHLARNISRVLKIPGNAWLGRIKNNPYIYGIDVTPPVIAKYEYAKGAGSFAPERDVAQLDYETNVYSAEGEIIAGTYIGGGYIILSYTEAFVANVDDHENKVMELFEKELGETAKKLGLKLYIKVAEDSVGCIKCMMGTAHKLKPDIVSTWSIKADMEFMLRDLKRAGIDPKYIFSDPAVPDKYKSFYWREAQAQKKRPDGSTTPVHVADRWHVVKTMSSFDFVDAMVFFKRNRVGKKNMSSYSLDNVTSVMLGKRKLTMGLGEGLSKIDWHKLMQRYHKIEYLVYNINDSLLMHELDLKTGDLSRRFSGAAGISEVPRMASGPTTLSDDYHFFLNDRSKVLACTGETMKTDLDAEIMSRRGWIATVSSKLSMPSLSNVLKACYNAACRVFTHCADTDIVSSYPVGGIMSNNSKGTTLFEICAIEGMREADLRRCLVNLTSVKANALALGKDLYGLPSIDTMLSRYKLFIQHKS